MSEYYSSKIITKKSNIIYMNKFHNFLKKMLYDKYIGKYKNNNTVLELAGGRGGDIYKLITNNVKYVTFIDNDKKALLEAKRRYTVLSTRTKVPKIKFFKGDLRNDLTNIIKKEFYQSVNMHFSIHYMMKNSDIIANLFKNINYGLKHNGIFIFTSMDGEKVLKLFEKYNIKKNQVVKLKKNNKNIFKLTKLFSDNKLQKYGQKINVYIETIGSNIEYLVNFKYLIHYFIKRNYKVLEDNNFSKIRDKYINRNKLSNAEIEYSNLNRYVVLQKL